MGTTTDNSPDDEEAPGDIYEAPMDSDTEEVEGGTIVDLGEEESEVQATVEFYGNLATVLPELELEQLSVTLLDLIDKDGENRKKREKDYEEALKKTGLAQGVSEGAAFSGSSNVVHPLLTRASIDFSSRAITEIFPSQGPVRDEIIGKVDRNRVEKAKRKSAYMNWQLRTQMPEFRPELEKLLTQLPLSGSQYLRLVFDERVKRPVPVFIPSDKVLVPASAGSFYSAERITYIDDITEIEFENRVADGLYRAVDVGSPGSVPDPSGPEKANEKIEGKTPSYYNEDGLRRIYECKVLTKVSIDQTTTPRSYLISIDGVSKKILAVVRNWEEDDPLFLPLDWISEWVFLPWRGSQGIGLYQALAGIPTALTGALRALLDSAHINNLPSLLRLRGSGISGQSVDMNICSVTEVDAPINTDDIRKVIMALPFNPPSQTLFQLMGALTEEGQSVLRTTFEDFADKSNQGLPVGTTLALIEQGMKVLSAIHLRMYESFDRTLKILHRINKLYLTDEAIERDTGGPLATRGDFQGPLDIIPTANPEVFSDVQRFAQLQIVAQRAQNNPLYDQRKVEEMILERTKIPNAKDLLVEVPTPVPMNPVNENVSMSLGRPVLAFPDQEHLAHIQVHLDYFNSPVLGQLPIISPTFVPPLLEHLKQHIVYWYLNHYIQTVESASEAPLSDIMKHKDPDTRKALEETLATASPRIVKAVDSTLRGIPEIVQKAQQILSALQQATPVPPEIRPMIEEVNQRREKAEIDAGQKEKDRQADLQKEQLRQSAEDSRTSAKIEAENQRNSQDNLTALSISQAEVLSNDHIDMKNGHGINP